MPSVQIGIQSPKVAARRANAIVEGVTRRLATCEAATK
jgi:phenylpyruvate tautomerase PptA (4-oxalocrotonate tautomerase family)